MSPGITGVRISLSSTSTMASKREGSKETSATGDAIEQVSMSLPFYEDTKLFIDRDIKMKGKDINDTLLGTFEEHLEDRRVYVNLQVWLVMDFMQGSCVSMRKYDPLYFLTY